ncbi:MAG TPA: hypothetical protein VFQ82_08185, partial [Stellaceae bacterium]|nr:hypothetical protein [Stellaceae bacterium]
SGNRVNLDEIEVVLASRLGVAVACAGEDERLVVALTAEGSPTDGDIRGLVRELFDIYAGAVHVRRVARFPQLDNGKVDYAAIDSPPVEAGGSDR